MSDFKKCDIKKMNTDEYSKWFKKKIDKIYKIPNFKKP